MKKAPERKPYPAWKAFRQAIARAILFLLLCCAFPARASQQLPTDIRIQFGNVEIVDTACWEGPESTWFVLVRTPDKMNRLLCYTRENGTWIQRFQTSSAVPQGPERVRIVITDKVQDFVNDRKSRSSWRSRTIPSLSARPSTRTTARSTRYRASLSGICAGCRSRIFPDRRSRRRT